MVVTALYTIVALNGKVSDLQEDKSVNVLICNDWTEADDT